jgi:hypothetical protein
VRWPVIGACALAVTMLTGTASGSGCTGSCASPPPRFRPAPGWVLLKPDLSEPSLSRGMVVAVTAADAPALRPFAPFAGFKRLRPQGILVWATVIGRVATSPFPPFPRGAWPPRLSAFRVDHGWEGQPASNIEQRLRAIAVACWNLDVRVYFATQHPSAELLAEAQAQLDRLLLPTC